MAVEVRNCVDVICPVCGKRFHHTLVWFSKHATIRCSGCRSTFEPKISHSQTDSVTEILGPAPKHSFHTKIAGVTFSNKDGTNRQDLIAHCRIGEELLLVREPDNPVDQNAVRVLRYNGVQLGYVPAHVCMTGLAAELDKGDKIRCRISDLTGGDGLSRGANIEIGDWDDEPRPLPDRQYSSSGATQFESSSVESIWKFLLILLTVLFVLWVLAR